MNGPAQLGSAYPQLLGAAKPHVGSGVLQHAAGMGDWKNMGCDCVTIGAAGGAINCGIAEAAIGDTVPIVEQGAGQAGAHGGGQTWAAATGATYVGGQTGAGRLNQLHGHRGHNRPVDGVQQQPDAVANAATASRTITFFIFCVSSHSSPGITAWVGSSDFPIQTLRAGPRTAAAVLRAICSVQIVNVR